MTTATSTNDRTDERGIRYFCDHNGSRVDYPTGTRFRDGYTQPQIITLRDDDDGLEMSDDSCGECGHPYKPGDETHYPECSRIDVS